MTDLILKYFPDLSAAQRSQIELLAPLYTEWNARINVVSRKDIDQLYLHHVLHSLSIAKLVTFKPGTSIMDAGTGGGFPGIPLAILFPDSKFTLVDSIGKKIKVVEAIAGGLGLANVTAVNARFEGVAETFDFITGRAVSNLAVFVNMLKNKVGLTNRNRIPNGILYLTGGDSPQDMTGINARAKEYPIPGYFTEPYFVTKKLIHIHAFQRR
jgi:16S rRNA (guanine527-N7)-methyltransferase